MSDEALAALAHRAGIAVDWIDAAGRSRRAAPDSLRMLLGALGLPGASPGDIAESRALLERQNAEPAPLIAGDADRPIALGRGLCGVKAKLHLANGETRDLELRQHDGAWKSMPIAEIGYHRLEIADREVTLAIAPQRCFGIGDVAPGERLWGLAVQLYGLRRDGDGGIGDCGGLIELAQGIARFGADAVALSPMHALFSARPDRFAPYSPSNRAFLNPLHAEPALVLGAERVRRVRAALNHSAERQRAERATFIDWPERGGEKLALLRALYRDFVALDLSASPATGLAEDFSRFRRESGQALERHALFEVLDTVAHGSKDWRDWPERRAELPPDGNEAKVFHIFLQWLADRSLKATQAALRDRGLRIGLIADLAVGADPAGSEAWSRQADMLTGVTIGAPPDLFNAEGQNWGLTALSPRAPDGTARFAETLRAVMRHVGGVRIDHAMGLARLWLIPEGAAPGDGAYLAYPFETMLRLIALESRLHRAVVIAEDLGTVPAGFSDRLNAAGILGLRVLWFERDKERFSPPEIWRRDAAAMTSTHDLPTIAGWWRQSDIEARSSGASENKTAEKAARSRGEAELWHALRVSGCTQGSRPPPRSTNRVVAGAIRFVARTPSRLALIPLEDLIGEEGQPNLPGTVDQHPNWRRRQKASAAKLLAAPKVLARLNALKEERGS